MSDPVATILTTAATVAALLLLVGASWKAARFLGRIVHFLDDWKGEDARPGIPRRPGVMERLSTVEHRTAQLEPNGGSHLADTVNRIERTMLDPATYPGLALPAPTTEGPTP